MVGDDPLLPTDLPVRTTQRTFTRLADYHTDDPVRFIADAQALDDHRLVVIERDGGRGSTAMARPVYAVDLAPAGGTDDQDAGRRVGSDPGS